MFALSGSASLLSSQRGRKMRCPYSCVALRNPWWYYKCMDYSKKHKLPPVPAGLSLSLCEYCFWFTLSFVPSACQRQSTNAHCICMYCMQWNRGDEAQGINPPVLICSPSVTQGPHQKVKIPPQLVHWRSLPHPAVAGTGASALGTSGSCQQAERAAPASTSEVQQQSWSPSSRLHVGWNPEKCFSPAQAL